MEHPPRLRTLRQVFIHCCRTSRFGTLPNIHKAWRNRPWRSNPYVRPSLLQTALHYKCVCMPKRQSIAGSKHTRLHKGCLRLPDHSECLGLTLITPTQLQTPVSTHDATIMKLTHHTLDKTPVEHSPQVAESLWQLSSSLASLSWGNPVGERALKLPWRSQLVQPPLLSNKCKKCLCSSSTRGGRKCIRPGRQQKELYWQRAPFQRELI